MTYFLYILVALLTVIAFICAYLAINLAIAPNSKLKSLHSGTDNLSDVINGNLHSDFSHRRTDRVSLGFSITEEDGEIVVSPNGTYSDHEVAKAIVR